MAITIDSDFPGGGVDAVRFTEEGTVEFEAPLDSGKQSLWFAFRVRGAKGRTLRFRQTGLEHVLGIHESRGYAPVCPVWRNAGFDWARLDSRRVRYDAETLDFSFEHDFTDDETCIAFCYPYTAADLRSYLAKDRSGLLRIDYPGTSDEGRDFPCVTVGDPDRPGLKNLVVVIARQHAGEVTGSYALEGMLDALRSGTGPAKDLLADTLFLFFPLADIDCVETGRYGKGQYPVDYNRDWSSAPWHRSTRIMQSVIARLAERLAFRCAIDLHAPQPGAPSYLVSNPHSVQDERAWSRFWRFAQVFEDSCRGRHSFSLADVDTRVLDWGSVYGGSMNSTYFHRTYGAVAFTVELSYHRDNRGALLDRDDWRSLGRLLAEACATSGVTREESPPPPDPRRIPPWVVPVRPGGWEHITLPRNLTIRTAGADLILDPEAPSNQAWMTCPERFAGTGGEGGRALCLSSDQAFTAIVHRSYFTGDCVLGVGKPEYGRFDAGEHVLTFSGMERPGDSYSVSIRLTDLRSGLHLRVADRSRP